MFTAKIIILSTLYQEYIIKEYSRLYVITYPKNISAVKKGKDKKVQVTEQPKDVISL